MILSSTYSYISYKTSIPSMRSAWIDDVTTTTMTILIMRVPSLRYLIISHAWMVSMFYSLLTLSTWQNHSIFGTDLHICMFLAQSWCPVPEIKTVIFILVESRTTHGRYRCFIAYLTVRTWQNHSIFGTDLQLCMILPHNFPDLHIPPHYRNFNLVLDSLISCHIYCITSYFLDL